MNTRRHHLRLILLTLAAVSLPPSLYAQNIAQIAKSDPLIISGAIGTNNTFYRSSSGYGSPLSNTFYANLNISVYGFSMPFSVYYANNNLAFNYPHFSFNASPTYKNWTLHLGQRSMNFGSYVFTMPFNGVGMEYNGKRLRFGAFYGTLKKAVNDNPEDPSARTPQYQRIGWGAKIGYGTTENYLDLYFLRARDELSSLYDAWHTTLPAQEDLVVGMKGRLSITRHFNLQANAAASVFSDDITADVLEVPELQRWDKIFTARYSSLARFAGDASMNLNFGTFNAALSYKMIQPDYKSLGVSYISNNMHALSLSASTNLFKRISLSANFSGQADNLSKQQMYTTEGFVYSANAATSFGQHVSLSAGYSGYRQLQADGTCAVVDSTRINRIMHNLSLSPTISFGNNQLTHSLSPSVSYSFNGDLNPYSNKNGETDVRTLAAGINYNLGLTAIETNINTAYSHQQSKGYNTQYSTDVVSVGTSRSFLADKNLDASINVNFINNHVMNQANNFSMGFDASVGYTLKEVHAFSFSCGYNKFNNINFVVEEDYTDTLYDNGYDLSMSLNYTYTFTLLQIKRRAEAETKAKTRAY